MKTAVIYLASGNSKRFGYENKLLKNIQTKPMYRYGLDRLIDICKEKEEFEVIVITQYQEIMKQIQYDSVTTVFCKESQYGISWSIKAGIKAAKDAEFYTFIKNTLGKELYSSIQINGEGFDQEWAQKSVKLLCYQRRKVFYGNNLFARGACSAGAERVINHDLKDYRYMSSSLVLSDVGMELRVMGAPAYYPLIESGRNWYESNAYVELILDGTKELVFIVDTMGEAKKKRIAMALPGLPERPERTTRLGVNLQYTSQDECRVTVKDLGFGEMFPSSGKEWTETTRWQEETK